MRTFVSERADLRVTVDGKMVIVQRGNDEIARVDKQTTVGLQPGYLDYYGGTRFFKIECRGCCLEVDEDGKVRTQSGWT